MPLELTEFTWKSTGNLQLSGGCYTPHTHTHTPRSLRPWSLATTFEQVDSDKSEDLVNLIGKPKKALELQLHWYNLILYQGRWKIISSVISKLFSRRIRMLQLIVTII